MDFATIVGIGLALAAILGGQVLEGGHVGSIVQPTAALIVIGGTLGAAAVQFPFAHLRRAASSLRALVQPAPPRTEWILERMLALAGKARREGLVAVERDVVALDHPFLRRAMELAVDGTEQRLLRSVLELELSRVEEEGEIPARVFEAMGGYAPTIGILGAVLGLIHVMENLSDPARLGSGIAVAFVATVYGVGSANLLFLPIAGKLKARLRESILPLEMIIEGTSAIVDGHNPRLIERQLTAYVGARRAGHEAGAPAVQAALELRVRG